MGLGEVVALRPVVGEVVQLPLFGVVVGTLVVLAHRFPERRLVTGDQRSAASHLEVLHRVGRCRRRVGQGVGEGPTGDRQLLEALVDLRSRRPDHLVDRWHDVGHVDELVAQRARLSNARGTHDHRHMHATFVCVLLVPLERRVAALRPTPRVVGVAVRATDVVDLIDHLVGRLEDAVEELHLVHDAKWAALLRRAVVGEHDERPCSPVRPSRRSPSTRRPI